MTENDLFDLEPCGLPRCVSVVPLLDAARPPPVHVRLDPTARARRALLGVDRD